METTEQREKVGSTSDCVTQHRREIFSRMPPQPSEKKDGQLPLELVEQFFQNGYLILHDFLPKEKLDACRKGIEGLVDKLAHFLYDAGKIDNLFEEHDFFTRLIHIDRAFPGSNIILQQRGELPDAFQQLWTDERLLNVVEQIIGPDIMGHPVWNLRTKIPNNDATVVPWHQDSAYLDDDAMEVLQLTAWIPFVDANLINGTLQVAERGHKNGRLAKHVCCHRGSWYVELPEEELQSSLNVDLEKDVKTCTVDYGGLVLFSNIMPHQSLPNLSNITRWSCDLRWQTPHKRPGFYGLKPGIIFRKKDEPDYKPDWTTFNSFSRSKIQLQAMDMKEVANDPFNTIVTGPWMKKWEIVNTNRHTDSFHAGKSYTQITA